MSKLTIYHHSKCKTSRDVLDLIRQSGIEPVIIQFALTPLNEEELRSLMKATGGSIRDILRQKGTPYDELDLENPKWTDEDLIGFIMEHPILMNRPIVSNGKKLCCAALLKLF